MSKSTHIAQELRAAIANGEWSSGERIMSESELCKRFGVSRPPVRSAIDMLIGQNILVSYRGKGTFVAENGVDAARSLLTLGQKKVDRLCLFEFRRIIETEAAALAAHRCNDEDIIALKKATIELQNAKTSVEAVEADLAFHYQLAKASGNDIIVNIFEMLQEPYREMFMQNVSNRGSDGAREHLQIVFAISSRDPNRARESMSCHLNNSMLESEKEAYYKSTKHGY